MLKVITLSTNQSNRQKPMVDATISRIYLMDEWPFHCICIWLVKWSKRRKTMKKRGWRCLLCSGAPCKDTLLTKFALRNACDWIQPCVDLCALRAPQPCDCYSTRLHRPTPQQGLFWVLPHTTWLAQLLRWHSGSLPRFTPTPWWFVSVPKLWTSMMFFMQGEERGKRPIKSDIWKLCTLSLFPLLSTRLSL